MSWYKNLSPVEQEFFRMQEEKKEEEALFTADSELTDEKKSPF